MFKIFQCHVTCNLLGCNAFRVANVFSMLERQKSTKPMRHRLPTLHAPPRRQMSSHLQHLWLMQILTANHCLLTMSTGGSAVSFVTIMSWSWQWMRGERKRADQMESSSHTQKTWFEKSWETCRITTPATRDFLLGFVPSAKKGKDVLTTLLDRAYDSIKWSLSQFSGQSRSRTAPYHLTSFVTQPTVTFATQCVLTKGLMPSRFSSGVQTRSR